MIWHDASTTSTRNKPITGKNELSQRWNGNIIGASSTTIDTYCSVSDDEEECVKSPGVTSQRTPFRVCDRQYQVSEKYLPDKASRWRHPIHLDGWIQVHDALCGEAADIRCALEAVQARIEESGTLKDKWIVRYIENVWSIHEGHVQDHLFNKEAVMVPYLKKRFVWPDEDQMDEDQWDLERQIDHIGRAIDSLQVGDSISSILKEWKIYEGLLISYLRQDEQLALHLMRAYFTPNEIQSVICQIAARSPKTMLGAMIYYMGGGDEFRKKVMKRDGIPWPLWHIAFRPIYKNYQKLFLSKIHAIQRGVPSKSRSLASSILHPSIW